MSFEITNTPARLQRMEAKRGDELLASARRSATSGEWTVDLPGLNLFQPITLSSPSSVKQFLEYFADLYDRANPPAGPRVVGLLSEDCRDSRWTSSTGKVYTFDHDLKQWYWEHPAYGHDRMYFGRGWTPQVAAPYTEVVE